MKRILLLLLFVFSFSAKAQYTTFQKIYGSSIIDTYNGNDLKRTYDGNYILTSFVYRSSSSQDAYLLKVAPDGTEIWNNSYYIAGTYLKGMVVEPTYDGGYIWGGMGGNPDVVICKTNSLGVPVWAKKITSTGGSDMCYDVIQTIDSGYVATGYSDISMFVVKFNKLGVQQWGRRYSGVNYTGRSVTELADSSLIIVGDGPGVGFVMHINKNGSIIWTKTTPSQNYSVVKTSDGNFAMTGNIYGSPGAGQDDITLIKFDVTGSIIWSRVYGTGDDEFGYCVTEALDDGFAITGYSNPGTGAKAAYIVKTNSIGIVQWVKHYGDFGSEVAHAITLGYDGGYILGGESNSFSIGAVYNMYIVKTDTAGNSGCYSVAATLTTASPSYVSSNATFTTATLTSSTVAISSISAGGETPICLILGDHEIQRSNSIAIEVYPNPFNSIFTLSLSKAEGELTIYNVLGKLIYSQEIVNTKMEIDLSKFENGIYFIQVKTENIIATKKIVKQ